jgi:ABC-type amino acid transport substrate-binding protein
MTTNIADYGFQALFAAIASKRIDVAISTITITPDRLKSVSFTQPYYDSDMGVAAKEPTARSRASPISRARSSAISRARPAKNGSRTIRPPTDLPM